MAFEIIRMASYSNATTDEPRSTNGCSPTSSASTSSVIPPHPTSHSRPLSQSGEESPAALSHGEDPDVENHSTSSHTRSRDHKGNSKPREEGSPRFNLLPWVVQHWPKSGPQWRDYVLPWKRQVLRRRRSFSKHSNGSVTSAHWKPRRLSMLQRPGRRATVKSDYVLDIRPHDSPEEIVEKLETHLPRLLPACKNIKNNGKMQITRLSGALTNSIYKVTVVSTATESEQTPQTTQKYLLRIYGLGVEELVEREKELYWLARLSELGIGPRMLSIFQNGRIEQYLESTTLTRDDIRDPQTSQHIARRMCELHSIIRTFPPRAECKPEVWVNVDKWYPIVLKKWGQLLQQYPERHEELMSLHIQSLKQDIAKVKARVTALNPPLVFGHNDLQYGNILRLCDGSEELVVIDFEYAGYNYRGFDIANHFCEWAADYHSDQPHRLDYSHYPSTEQQRWFLNAYLDEHQRLTGSKGDDDTIQQLLVEVNCMRTVSHLFWGLWGLLQASNSDIDFDYVGYARQRLTAFYEELEVVQQVST
ncbi:hypothetical protein IWQ62_000690 [Dispira parvispora]|uniref:Choline kinase n=1 Tax=Dispira parvispora TaxID=1520584 RepID=A0A9W8E4Q8_9FUNG|nr:hypothetical protein IWQ62_000690 [Dispira parvispora]